MTGGEGLVSSVISGDGIDGFGFKIGKNTFFKLDMSGDIYLIVGNV